MMAWLITNWRPAALLSACLACFYGGWEAKAGIVAREQVKEIQDAQEARLKAERESAELSVDTEKKLAALRAQNRNLNKKLEAELETVFTMIALCLLAACSPSNPIFPLLPPANLVQMCDPLPDFDGKDMGDLLRYTTQIMQLYHECEARHTGLAHLVQ